MNADDLLHDEYSPLGDESDETLTEKQTRFQLLIDQLERLLASPAPLTDAERAFCQQQIAANRELIARIG